MKDEVDTVQIQQAVKRRYAEVSRTAGGYFKYPTGRTGATRLGYDPTLVQRMPDELLESFCGVGNPFSLGPINPGERVLDVGCGAGFDLIVASGLVGPSGRTYGIDLTPEMIERARGNLRIAGVSNSEVRQADSASIPYADNTFDVVISNGVLNLSPSKEESLQEIYRALRPLGRLQFADIVRKEDLPPEVQGSLRAWSE